MCFLAGKDYIWGQGHAGMKCKGKLPTILTVNQLTEY